MSDYDHNDYDRYAWKDRRRANRPKQRYSLIGLLIIVLCWLCIAMMIVDVYDGSYLQAITKDAAQRRQVRECSDKGQTAVLTSLAVSCVEAP